MTVSRDNSKAVYQGIKAAHIRFLTALDLALPENAFRFRRAAAVSE